MLVRRRMIGARPHGFTKCCNAVNIVAGCRNGSADWKAPSLFGLLSVLRLLGDVLMAIVACRRKKKITASPVGTPPTHGSPVVGSALQVAG